MWTQRVFKEVDLLQDSLRKANCRMSAAQIWSVICAIEVVRYLPQGFVSFTAFVFFPQPVLTLRNISVGAATTKSFAQLLTLAQSAGSIILHLSVHANDLDGLPIVVIETSNHHLPTNIKSTMHVIMIIYDLCIQTYCTVLHICLPVHDWILRWWMQRQMWELFSRMILEAHTSSTVRNWRSCLEMDSNLAWHDTFSAEESVDQFDEFTNFDIAGRFEAAWWIIFCFHQWMLLRTLASWKWNDCVTERWVFSNHRESCTAQESIAALLVEAGCNLVIATRGNFD